MPTDEVRAEVVDSTLVLTLNRPEKLNAINYNMIGFILEELWRAETDANIRAVLLQGNGRAYCAGDDVKGMGTPARPMSPGEHPIGAMQQAMIRRWFWLPKPTIVAIKGRCHGIGQDMALAADFRIVSTNAVMGDMRAKRAIGVGSGGTFLLPMLIGFPAANALMLTGDTIEINEIERLGLAYKVVEPEKLDTEALQFAATMASGPTKALGIMKYELRRNLRQSLDDALALELQYLGPDVVVEDRAEGARSFAEGRTPVFTGR